METKEKIIPDYNSFSYSTTVRTISVKIISIVVIFISVALMMRLFVVGISRIDGPSMEPSYIDQQWIVFEKASYAFRSPERFDVIEMIDPLHQRFLIKRIIGLPGETVVIKEGSVFIQSSSTPLFRLEEPYLRPQVYTAIEHDFSEFTIRLGNDEYAVLGDNRLQSSSDSRTFGPVHRSQVVARVITAPR
jgi:signal peptidase I